MLLFMQIVLQTDLSPTITQCYGSLCVFVGATFQPSVVKLCHFVSIYIIDFRWKIFED